LKLGTDVNIHRELLCPGVLVCCVAVLPLSAGQAPGQYRLSVDVPQVVLNVTVQAKNGDFVPQLEAGDFAVYDQGKLRPLTAFSKEERPATVGLVLDNSRSMTPRRPEVLQAAATFVSLSHADDDFFVVHFNENVRLGFDGARFSSDRTAVRMALWRLRPAGQTALYDAVNFALGHVLEGRWERRALLMISDGGDNASKASFEEVHRKARRLGASIYAIGIYDPTDPDRSPKVLRSLAMAGGGLAFFPQAATELAAICGQIAAEIRSQYTLAFTPSDIGIEGKFHKIRVQVKGERGKKLFVRAREGYYEPGKE
jgi:Ca-activated chloride channel family protein